MILAIVVLGGMGSILGVIVGALVLILLPEYLREFAQVKKNVVLAGLYNRIELWDKAAWEKYRKGTEQKSGDIAEALGELGV